MDRIRILDPTAAPPEVDADPGPPAGPLRGKTIGLRFDQTWRSFLHVLQEWEPRLEATGATLRRWDASGRVGEEGERTRRALDAFVDDLDVAIVGLGN